MILIYTLIAAFILGIVRLLALARKMYEENENTLSTTTNDHVQHINATVLQPDSIPQEVNVLSEEDMAVFYSESPFFDCYRSPN